MLKLVIALNIYQRQWRWTRMEFAQREVSTVSLPVERRLALAPEAELDLFDPRRYAGSTFITEGGLEYHVYQDGGKCLLVGMNGEFGPAFST